MPTAKNTKKRILRAEKSTTLLFAFLTNVKSAVLDQREALCTLILDTRKT
jgi:hypothetical protein